MDQVFYEKDDASLYKMIGQHIYYIFDVLDSENRRKILKEVRSLEKR